MVGDMRHVTLSWSYSGGQGRLVAGTYRRFSQWLNVPPGGTHTFELRGTAYENPPISLSVFTDDGGAGDINQSIYLDWPCEHSYFFGYVPHRCPYAPAATTNASQQDFENGRMIWLAETDTILVLYDDGSWREYDNAWQEGDPIDDPAIQAPSGLFQPIRGFGEVWRNQNEHDGVRDRLGWAVTPEQAYTTTFQHSIAESVGQNLLYLTLQDDVLVYQLTGYDLGSGPWSPVPPAEAATN
jgi:hypothetical protein